MIMSRETEVGGLEEQKVDEERANGQENETKITEAKLRQIMEEAKKRFEKTLQRFRDMGWKPPEREEALFQTTCS
jgi:hypothetical protein